MKGISQALKSADEVKAVAAELQRNPTTNLFYCLWVFMYESGLRISDVLKLKYEDVEGQSNLKVKQEKTGNVVRPKVTAAMLSWHNARQNKPLCQCRRISFLARAISVAKATPSPVTRYSLSLGRWDVEQDSLMLAAIRREKVGAESYLKMQCRLKLSPTSWGRQIHAQPCTTSGLVRTCRTI